MAARNHQADEPASATNSSTSYAPNARSRWPTGAHPTGRRARPRKATSSGRYSCRFQLRPGQLLIVDEASLAGTLTLDQLATQASAAGAKLLLVGDHRQLSSVDAGGAFGLLATQTNAVELTSLWRFDHAWEAAAGQQLRVGDTDVPRHLRRARAVARRPRRSDDRRRLRGVGNRDPRGPQCVTHRRRQRHRRRTEHPSPSRTRPRRASSNRSASGLHDDTIAGVGDIVVTRRNRRDLRTSTGAWVRNGDLWTVTARDDDGSLTVQRKDRSARASTSAASQRCGCPPTTSRSMSNSATPPPRTAPKA